jgi:hypothetical protein
MSNNATKPKPTKKTRHKPSEKTKKRLRRARRGKAKCTGPPKARKLRSKRKLALLERRTRSILTVRPRYEVADRDRGSGPPVRNVESSVLGSNRDCTRCSRRADHVVIWEYWLGGYWRQAKRHQCAKHAGKLAARLGRAR